MTDTNGSASGFFWIHVPVYTQVMSSSCSLGVVGSGQRQAAFARRSSPFPRRPNLGAELLFASSAQAYVILILAINPWAERRQSGVSLAQRVWIECRKTRAARMLPPCAPAIPYSTHARRERPCAIPLQVLRRADIRTNGHEQPDIPISVCRPRAPVQGDAIILRPASPGVDDAAAVERSLPVLARSPGPAVFHDHEP